MHHFHHGIGGAVQIVLVLAEDLDGQIAAYAGEHLGDAHLDGLGEGIGHPGEILQYMTDAVHEGVLVRHRPFFHGLEYQEAVGLVQTHRVQAQLVGAGAGDDAGHLRHPLDEGTLHRHVDLQGLFQIDGRQFFQLHDEIAFIHGGHEGLAHLGVEKASTHQDGQGHGDHGFHVVQAPGQHRGVDLLQQAHQPRLLVGHLAQQVGGEHGDHREGKQQGSRQGEDDGQGHGNEQLAFQALQGEQGQEYDDDDEDARGHGHRHFPRGAIDEMHARQAAFALVGQVSDDVLHHYHGSVHQHANGNGQAAQGHKVGRHAELLHHDEGH